MQKLKIFLSSTMVDLRETRQSVLRFLQVLPSDLISMEIFGSDESKPKDFCLGQVRKCSLFIGIYAERYGNIDDETGLSITELEYREALKVLQSGDLIGLLIYIIDPKATWPLNLIDREQENIQKLKALKEQITKRHTVTFFKLSEELPFLILRDVIRKIGFSTKQIFRPRTKPKPPKVKKLDRPVGMEYYTEELAPLFYGREEEADELLNHIIKQKMSLLIGASGIGKTSLINAGLFPKLHDMGWRTALIRPLTDPLKNLCSSLWAQLLKGVPPEDFDFPAVVHSAVDVHAPTHVLIVIDQFEDILGPKAFKDAEPITRALLDLYSSAESNVRFLITYRGDVEAQIGSTWQKVSGSAGGLPRLYLGPLTKVNCEKALKANLKALEIALAYEGNGNAQRFVTQVVEDLTGESLLGGFTGVYPPFLQMIISRACADANAQKKYTESAYVSAGRCRRIIADYLIGQLKYLGKNKQKGEEVLIALVSSYGSKSQKTVGEIADEALQNRKDVERTLRSLIDLRLVRSINDHFEIVHDFLAKTIVTELVSADEREAKKFKEVLASRTAAYPTTKANLARAEHLHIYKYRSRIFCNEDEARLLLASYLLGNGPVYYWLKSYPKERIIAWARSMLLDEDYERNRNVYRFLIKLGERIDLEDVTELFSEYKLKSELGEFILKLANPSDLNILLKLHRKKGEEVVAAAEETLSRLVSYPNNELFDQLGKSNTQSSQRLFEILALRFAQELSLVEIRNMWKAQKQSTKLLSLYGLGIKGTAEDLEWLQELLKEKTLKQKSRAAAVKSIVRLSSRFGKAEIVETFLKKRALPVKRVVLQALDSPFSSLNLKEVLNCYEKLPRETARAVRCLASEKDLPVLKETLKSISLDPTAREFALAICDNGGEAEFDFLWNLLTEYKGRIDFWNVIVVFRAMAKLAGRKHLNLLNGIIELEEFWNYYPEDERPEQRIPVADFENVYFIRRLVGITYAKIAGRRQFKKLLQLLRHNYWIISDAAADAVMKLAKPSELPGLIDEAISSQSNQDAIIKALSYLDEKYNYLHECEDGVRP